MPHIIKSERINSELSQFTIHPDSVNLLPYDFCARSQAVILNEVDYESDEPVIVGTTNPNNYVVLKRIMKTIEKSVEAVQLNQYEVNKALNIGFQRIISDIDDKNSVINVKLTPIENLDFSKGLEISKIVNDILGHAIYRNASDIHIETYEDDNDLRFRIDGVLQQIQCTVTPENMKELISRIKILANLDIQKQN